ncbi:unnamed protein product [Paramecium primaurelia]|uniref:Uncharacterized protein n=1 Tax=Paramecium primaurelia TaxID=5886 RepID=A0A8S1PSN8_PARPR|nr:unnamed protein product [Paramecium primaurelia]
MIPLPNQDSRIRIAMIIEESFIKPKIKYEQLKFVYYQFEYPQKLQFFIVYQKIRLYYPISLIMIQYNVSKNQMKLFLRNTNTRCLRLKIIDQEFKNSTQQQYIKEKIIIPKAKIKIYKLLKNSDACINYTKQFQCPILNNLINILELF